ncbi:uncharacterized protein [Panulirus ornatus]|uniref:uncharacterized protein n=1 Tax=Panulirus ornatus TaxID=150431 RepID=UPI003A865018
MSHPASDGVLSIPALGRPFHLGALYDCRNEKLISGITLWDKETLDHKRVQKFETADFEVIASDSLEDKASALDVNASMKLSFLGGLLQVSGSAKYLDNRRSSNHQERVTLQYKCTTKSETLTMQQMGEGKIQHPNIFDHGTATHVVSGIEYGGQAFFVFERDHTSSSSDKNIDGSLHLLVKAIPTFSIDGEGKLNLSEDDKKKTESFSCKFYGDFMPRENPSSFRDAVQLYREIPSLIGGSDTNSIPVKVVMYPLALLDSKASKMVREISANLISNTENIFEDLHEVNVKCNDMSNSQAVKKFGVFQKDISTFKRLIATYKLEFQRRLSTLLPVIRGGGAEESDLAAILRDKESSPYSQQALHLWIQSKEKQLKILTKLASELSAIKFLSQPGDLESTHLSLENDCTLCLAILIPQTCSHLKKMAKYIDKEDIMNESYAEELQLLDPLMYRNNGDRSMTETTRLFRKFFESNTDRKGTAFVVSGDFSRSEEFQAQIRCYKHGRLVVPDYALPSEPGTPLADEKERTHDSVTIQWTKPTYGVSSVRQYEILCQKTGENESPLKVRTDSDSVKFIISNLCANSKYQVSVRACCEVGLGPSSNTSLNVSTKPTSPPGKPKVSQTSPTTVAIQWTKPTCIGSRCSIQKYIIKQQGNAGKWTSATETHSGDELSCTMKVLPNSKHTFRIIAYCGTAGYSVASEPTDIIVKAEPSEILKEKLCAESSILEVGCPNVYKPDLKLIYSRDNHMLQKCEFGVNRNVEEKVIMVVGSTGSGKTTLINGMINYIFGVKWKDSIRFKLISEPTEQNQSRSQTKLITSYTIHHRENFTVPYTLTIIDTPGFGDTSGVMRDREITEQIRSFFSTGGMCGIDHIDAVGFVVQSSLPRLTPTQTYIFDQILSLFGKDIKDNILLLLTFADGQNPQVLSGIHESGMPYKKYMKFNNSALFAKKSLTDGNKTLGDDSDCDEEESVFDEMFWKMGEKSYKDLLRQLNMFGSKSLTLTKDVLNERHQLQVYIAGIQRDIQVGLVTLEKLQTEVQVLKIHQADIDKNKAFTYTVDEEITEMVTIPAGQYITNCLQCNRTCHENCAIREDENKSGCWAIRNDYCCICPSKCHWSVHKNFPKKYVVKIVTVTKTADDLKKRYQEATEKKLSAENLIIKVQDEFEAVQLKVLGMTEAVRKSLQRLQEIALKPNPLSTLEYIDLMIDSEQTQARPGWQARVQQLRNVRKETEYMQDIARQGFDPFIEYRKKIGMEKKSKKNGYWSRAGEFIKNIFQ